LCRMIDLAYSITLLNFPGPIKHDNYAQDALEWQISSQ
jgi:hypothetical protein